MVERAQQAGVDTFLFRPKEYASREAYEHEIIAELQRRGIDLIVMAGYMRIITIGARGAILRTDDQYSSVIAAVFSRRERNRASA